MSPCRSASGCSRRRPSACRPSSRRTVIDFCEPIERDPRGLRRTHRVTHDFDQPDEQLGVAFELAEPAAESEEGDRELRLVADRFYETMPEEIQAGGCNFLEPGGIEAWAGEGVARLLALAPASP